jgi:hypothetical protein
VEYGMLGHTGNHSGHRNWNYSTKSIWKHYKAKYSTDSLRKQQPCYEYHVKRTAKILKLKAEWLGSPLVQEEKYQGKTAIREEEITVTAN